MDNDALEDINQSVQKVEQAVQDLQQSVDKVEQAIKDKWNSLQAIGLVFIAIWMWSLAEDAWHATAHLSKSDGRVVEIFHTQ